MPIGRLILAAAVWISVLSPWISPVQAQALSEAAAARRVAADYGVEVLRVKAGRLDDQAVWLVTFMVPGGDSNAAFQVNTLAIDQASGALVPSFRHRPSGYDLPPRASGGAKSEDRPDVLRSRTWR